MISWPPWRRRSDPTMWCSTSAPGAACLPWRRPGPVLGASTRSKPATLPKLLRGCSPLTACRDQVTLFSGWSRLVELPERADLLVAEVVGNEPLEEEILETVLDARQRLLKPGARMIPHALTLLARPILLPEAEVRQRAFGVKDVERWQALYDIDFTPLLDAAIPGPTHTITEGEVVATWPPVGPPVEVTRVDLTNFDEPSLHTSTDLVVEPPGLVNGIALTFRAELYEGITHTLDPWTWPASSWATSVWVLPDLIEVTAGSVLRVDYRRRVPGVPDGLICELLDGRQ